jgi:NAD(P)-dependent dehydrogenase (short-subunit alcohol dehydrogenase family)
LARNGARVVVNDVGAGAAAVVDEIVAAGGEAIVSTESVATAEGREAIVATAVEAFGRIEIVVNNAGILGDKTFGKIDWDDFDAVHAVHLRSSAYVSQPAYRLMKEQGYGRFVFVSSNAGTFGSFGQSAYSSAKAGIIGLSNTIAIEGARAGILSNVLCPIAFTQMTESILAGSTVFDPGHVAPLVAFLASEACKETHAVFSAGAGHFARVFTGLTSGWSVEPGGRATVADIEANLAQILDVADFSVPLSAPEEIANLADYIAAQEKAAAAARR